MSWTEAPGRWMPVLHHSNCGDPDTVVCDLSHALATAPDSAWTIHDDLTIAIEAFSERARKAVAEADSGAPFAREMCAFLAAFGSDGCSSSAKGDQIADTAFRTMSGAGHQHFLAFMRELQQTTKRADLERTLFRVWDYADDKPSMRWDPNDYRPHALRADNPSKDPIRTMRGANRLAIEALPLFPTMPTLMRLRTTAFIEEEGIAAALCPVWEDPLDVATVSSLLALSDVERIARATDARERARLRRKLMARGVRQVYWVERFTDGKYRNFKPSVALL